MSGRRSRNRNLLEFLKADLTPTRLATEYSRMSEREVVVVVVAVGLVCLVAADWVRSRERAGAIPQGKFSGFAVSEVAFFLMPSLTT